MVAESHLSSPSGASGASVDAAQPRPPPKRRKRAVISCVECHRRKQKVRSNPPARPVCTGSPGSPVSVSLREYRGMYSY